MENRGFDKTIGADGWPIDLRHSVRSWKPISCSDQAETQPHDRALRFMMLDLMMLDLAVALAIGLVIGFILGYGVRALVSYQRHQRARRRSYLV